MAGKLIIDTLETGSGSSVPVATVVQGSAKAWVNFNGTGTVAIRDDFNVSSITDNGTGDYTVNFDSAMPSTNYCLVGSNGEYSGATGPNIVSLKDPTNALTTSARIMTRQSSTAIDAQSVNVAFFGD